MPRTFHLLLLAHIALILIQMLNPNVANWLVPLIGAKVWLTYIPLFPLIYSMLNTRGHLVKFLRILTLLVWFPTSLGVIQWLTCKMIGYHTTMNFFYGKAAYAATQGFAEFSFGTAFYRIPSTFSYAAQYNSYLWTAMIVTYMLMWIDTDEKWRHFAKISFVLVLIASLSEWC